MNRVMNSVALLASMLVITSSAMAGQPAAFAENPGAKVMSAAPATSTLKGKVLETMNAGSYTYAKLSTPAGEIWAAVPQASIKVGSEIGIENPMTMDGFESKALKRKFAKIVFGTLENGAGSPAAKSPHGALPAGPIDLKSVKVEKASGADARTIEEIFAHKAKLNGQKVTVRGKVVKVNMGIMNKNWIHLRDGSGSADAGNFDLIVTSQSAAKMGDVVEAKGTVAADRDLGAGYKYSVLVEDAKLVKP